MHAPDAGTAGRSDIYGHHYVFAGHVYLMNQFAGNQKILSVWSGIKIRLAAVRILKADGTPALRR